MSSLPLLPRRTLLGGALAGSALAMAGCSPAPVASLPAATSTEVIGNKELTVYAWTNGPTIDANFKKSVELFNTEMAGKFTAKINFLPYDQYWQKIQLQYAANQPFDMYYWDVQAYAHYKKGLLQNVQPAVDGTDMADPAKYPVDLYKPWKFDEQGPVRDPGEHPVDVAVLQQDALRQGRPRLPRRHLDLGQGHRGRNRAARRRAARR